MKLHTVLTMVAVAVVAPLASAEVICTYVPDDDGALTLNNPISWDEPTYTLSAAMTQHSWPGHMLGFFDEGTDSVGSMLWVRNTVYNGGEVPPFVWTDFHLNISMDHPFSIDDTFTLPDWTVPNVTQPSLQGTVWIGSVDYLGGTAINPGEWGEFDVLLSFTGPILYTIEMIPTPEPAAALLLALGGLLLRGKR